MREKTHSNLVKYEKQFSLLGFYTESSLLGHFIKVIISHTSSGRGFEMKKNVRTLLGSNGNPLT